MPTISLDAGLSLHCTVDDYLWPWVASTPVLMMHGCARNASRIASQQQKILADTLPRGRLELLAGYGHGVNLLLPEHCARTALDFWRTVEAEER